MPTVGVPPDADAIRRSTAMTSMSPAWRPWLWLDCVDDFEFRVFGLAAASGRALTLRCLRFLLFEPCLHGEGQASRFHQLNILVEKLQERLGMKRPVNVAGCSVQLRANKSDRIAAGQLHCRRPEMSRLFADLKTLG